MAARAAWPMGLVAAFVALAGAGLPRAAEARALLCTNRPSVTQEAVEFVAGMLALDASGVVVFRPGLEAPSDPFAEVYIIEEMDKPGIMADCAAFAGIDAAWLRAAAEVVRAEIGTRRAPAPGVPELTIRGSGKLFETEGRSVWVGIAQDSAAFDVFNAIVTATGGGSRDCFDPLCISLVEGL